MSRFNYWSKMLIITKGYLKKKSSYISNNIAYFQDIIGFLTLLAIGSLYKYLLFIYEIVFFNYLETSLKIT